MNKPKLLKKLLIPALCVVTLMGCAQQKSYTGHNTTSQVEVSQSADKNNSASDSKNNSTIAKDKSDSAVQDKNKSTDKSTKKSVQTVDLKNIPAFSNKAYVEINNNKPYFTDSDYTTTSFERYSNLDSLGRCGVAYANIGRDLMPTSKREPIGSVKPSGWHSVKYNNVDGKYLYNRCHLIGFQLTAENANPKNLITGTRYLNVDGMLPFENMVADYIKETGNHVLYRVTPIFEGNNLVASGVLMEAKSVEDKGKGICFNIYAYNNQPGITINYADGSSYFTATGEKGTLSNSVGSSSSSKSNSYNSSSYSNNNASSNNSVTSTTSTQTASTEAYVLNTNSHKFHRPSCSSAEKISASNRKDVKSSRDKLISEGYEPCKKCNP